MQTGRKQLTQIGHNDQHETPLMHPNKVQSCALFHSLQKENRLNTRAEIHLFFIETELQALAVSATVSKIQDCAFIIYSFNKHVSDKLLQRDIQSYYLDKECRGFINRIRKTRQYLKQISDSIPAQATDIHLYFPRIDQFYQNVIINHMRLMHTSHDLHFSLIPDGLLNVLEESCDHKRVASRKEKKRDFFLKLTPDIKYHYFDGCSIGADDDIFSNIYMWENIPTNYPAEKIRKLQIPAPVTAHKTDEIKVLIIGQRIIDIDNHDENTCHRISEKIQNYLKFIDASTIDYLPHPRSAHMELNNGSTTVTDNSFSAEELILNSDYSHIVGCCSTAMANAKVLNSELNVVSVGMEDFIREPDKQERLKNIFQALGITVL